MQDLPFGQRSIVLSDKTTIKIPNVIRTLIPERVVQQYTAYCDGCNRCKRRCYHEQWFSFIRCFKSLTYIHPKFSKIRGSCLLKCVAGEACKLFITLFWHIETCSFESMKKAKTNQNKNNKRSELTNTSRRLMLKHSWVLFYPSI